MLLLDVTHTSHTRAQTGIQRVCRALASELARSEPTQLICFDPHQHAWRTLNAGERRLLADRRGGGSSRGAKWTLTQKLLGRVRRLTGTRAPLPPGTALVCPEIFSPQVAAELPALFSRVSGPRVALFHDAIALEFPQLSPPATVKRMPQYLRELARFDGIAAVSEDSARVLCKQWVDAGLAAPPPVRAIPLGVDPVPGKIAPPAPGPRPRVLCVSTIEGRKNHLTLLAAAETLWREGVEFELELIGLPRADTAAAALSRLRQLQKSGRALLYHGSVTDDELHAAYARCAFTVYPSLREGFGLPVLESLQHGRPCICSNRGALGETVRGGGVLGVDEVSAEALAAAMRRLLREPRELAALAGAARARKFRSWSDYVHDLRQWMQTLRSRA